MRHFLHLNDFSKKEIYHIFELADKLNAGNGEGERLSKKMFVFFCPKNSIRTRVSFEKGIKMLGGDIVLFSPEVLDKKEDIKDVIGYLENWADMVIIRHKDLSLIEYMAEHSNIPIINAMTAENHPCEILADLYSFSKKYTNFPEKKYLFVGANGNIGNTWKEASELVGFQFTQCCPRGYEIEGANVCYDIDKAVVGKDVICTDSIPTAAKDDFKGYQITLDRLRNANADVCLNPCPPFFRGGEVSADAIDSQFFVGYEFKKALMEVQQAIICYLLGHE